MIPGIAANRELIAQMEKKIQSTLARREGRSYEPASVLLERIRKERETAAAPKKPHSAGMKE